MRPNIIVNFLDLFLNESTSKTTYIFVLITLSTSFNLNAQIANPKTYYSTNHEYILNVNPSNKYGVGKADYEFLLHEKPIWKKTLSDTFVDVKISNSGAIFAYSYSLGIEARLLQTQKKKDILSLWSLKSDGEVVFKKDYIRGETQTALHALDEPRCNGILLQEIFDTVVFRMTPDYGTDDLEKWLQYSIKNGKPKTDILIDWEKYNFISDSLVDVIPITHLGYYLLYFSDGIFDRDYGVLNNAMIQLRDSKGKLLWEKVAQADISSDKLGVSELTTLNFLTNHKMIAYSKVDKTFSIKFLSQNKTIDYRIIKSNIVKEVSSHQTNFRKLLNKKQPIAQKQLSEIKLIKTIHLSKTKTKTKTKLSLPKRISNFAINNENKVALLNKNKSHYYFSLISSENKLLKQFLIDNKLLTSIASYETSFKHWHNNKWLLLVTKFEQESKLFVIDNKQQTIKKLNFPIADAYKIQVHNDSSLSFLIKKDYLTGILHLNIKGDVLWQLFEKSENNPVYMYSADDLAIDKNNNLLVLGDAEGGKKLNYFSKQGRLIKSILLQTNNKEDLDFSDNLTVVNNKIYLQGSDKEDFLVVYQFSLDGNFLNEKHLMTKNGQKFNYINDLKSGNNSLWVNDNNIYQFNEDLEETKHYGSTEQQRLFDDISWIDVDSEQKIKLFNEKTFSFIGISDKDKKLSIISLAKHLRPSDGEGVFIDAGNNIYFNLGQANFAIYSKTGDYNETINLDENCKQYCTDHFLAHRTLKNTYWQTSDNGISLKTYKNGEIKTIKTIKKDINSNWLRNIYNISSDAKGRLIFSDKSFDRNAKGDNIHIIGANGEMINSINLVNNNQYIDGLSLANDFIFLKYSDENTIRILNFEGNQVYQIELENKKSNCSNTVFYADSLSKKLYVYQNKKIFVYSIDL